MMKRLRLLSKGLITAYIIPKLNYHIKPARDFKSKKV